MSNESVFLPAAVRDRIWDLLKERKVTQAELAAKIGCSESALSRFISGKTDKLGNENIIRIARAFDVSTDFLLGEVDEPDRKNYDISELGLSVEAARNLYTQKVNPKIVSYLLENPQFADTTYQIARYLDNELTSGFAAQNQLYSMVSSMLGTVPQAADEVKSLRTPIDQAELSSIQNSFMKAVRAVKKEAEAEMPPTRQLTAQAMKSIYAELTKGGQRLNRKITKEQIADAVGRGFLYPFPSFSSQSDFASQKSCICAVAHITKSACPTAAKKRLLPHSAAPQSTPLTPFPRQPEAKV